MADAYTTTASLNSVQAAYDLRAYFGLRPNLIFDQIADVKPTDQTQPGSSVKFTKYTDMAVATAALNESVDVDAVALADAQVTVTLVEQGNAAVTTAKLRGTSFMNVDRDASNMVNYNAGLSMDTVARTPLGAGTNVLYGGSAAARNQVTPTSTLTASNVRRVQAELESNSAMRWPDGYYRAIIHPDVAYDLKSETGEASWNYPHANAGDGSAQNIWQGTIGRFNGFDFLANPRAEIVSDAGSSTTLTDVYKTIFVGQQALAKAWSRAVSAERPQIILGPVTDKLRRFHPIGWYQLVGYGRFREESLYRYETSSSIGANA